MFSTIKAARLLGWTSIAVGVTELAATKWLEEEMGVDDHDGLIRGYGVREIAAGVMILSQPGLNKQLAAGLWSRVVGDAMDIFTIAQASQTTQNRRGLSSILTIVLAVTGLDVLVATRTQLDLAKAKAVAMRARQRVTPTSAIPNGPLLKAKERPASSFDGRNTRHLSHQEANG